MRCETPKAEPTSRSRTDQSPAARVQAREPDLINEHTCPTARERGTTQQQQPRPIPVAVAHQECVRDARCGRIKGRHRSVLTGWILWSRPCRCCGEQNNGLPPMPTHPNPHSL